MKISMKMEVFKYSKVVLDIAKTMSTVVDDFNEKGIAGSIMPSQVAEWIKVEKKLNPGLYSKVQVAFIKGEPINDLETYDLHVMEGGELAITLRLVEIHELKQEEVVA